MKVIGLLAFGLMAFAQAHAQDPHAATAETGTRDDDRRYIISDVLIESPGGAKLSAIVVRPRGSVERLPTSLRFTIYVNPLATHLAKVAADHGYVGVVAFARGKRSSPDPIEPWEHEVQDTYAVIDWISRQPWSNGQVGMYGASYDGFTQWAAAKGRHPALKTIVPGSASFAGFGLPMQNNVFQSANYVWPFYVMDNRELDEAINADAQRWSTLNDKWYASGRPYREIDLVDGKPNPLLQKQLRHPAYDSYWQAMQPYREDYARLEIPVLTVTGYFDAANSAATHYLVEHYTFNRNANHYLLVGPYPHASSLRSSVPTVIGSYEIDPVAQIDTLELTYQWFDFVMRGGRKPALLADRINYEVMGANVWRHAASLQATGQEKRTLYLTTGSAGDRYQLRPAKPRALEYLEEAVDLADRKGQNNLFSSGGIEDIPRLESGFAFVSEPLDEPISVDGLITGSLDVSINKRDFDFALSVYELMPSGKGFLLSYYLGRASYADDMSRRKLLTPNTRVRLPFSRTAFVSRQMSKGSRLLVMVTVNKNAWAQVNYGSGKDVSDESASDAGEPLRVRWYNDSFVTVPVSR